MNHARGALERLPGALYWVVPPVFCVWLYWYGIKAWFQADDFAWLSLRQDITDWHSLLGALFGPRAQGTIRPWSERAFFLVFYSLFGLDALPYRIWVFLTQAANLVLVAVITRRLTGSRAAGFWAAIFWTVNSTLAWLMTWTAAYNQVLCAFFLLLAFYFLLKSIEIDTKTYKILHWAAFILGFGAQELNMVYPALAGAFTWFCARKHFRRILPMFAVSTIYLVLHFRFAPPQGGLYTPYYDLSMLRMLAIYWSWTAGPVWLSTPWNTPPGWVLAGVSLITAVLLGFAVRRALRRDYLPVFFLAWYVAAIAPLLPLRDHPTDYYPYIAAIGFAMLGGTAFAAAWRSGTLWKTVAAVTAVVYLVLVVPCTLATTERFYRRSRKAERVVLGLAHAHELHPHQAILLHGVDEETFGIAILDQPYRLFNALVFLSPGTEKNIPPRPEYGDVSSFVLPASAVIKALDNDELVVYSAAGERLKNITRVYTEIVAHQQDGAVPRRVDVANPLLAYLTGPTWYRVEELSRWMPRQATVRIGGPSSPDQKLYVHGNCPGGLLEGGPVDLRISADGLPVGTDRVTTENSSFDFVFALPRPLTGKGSITLTVEASRTFRPPGEDRDLSFSFGTFEIR